MITCLLISYLFTRVYNPYNKMFIIDEELLERLICSQCKKYLSVKTTKVYPNRGVKCGRCSNPADAGVVSLFEVLAEQALFRCVNRFEGCNRLLSYSDVEEHEKFCLAKEYDCPCCIERFRGSTYDIYVHFKEEHSTHLLINTPEFFLEIDNELFKSYLYRKNDFLFFVDVTYNRGEKELILNISYLGTDEDASRMSQMFTLHSLDGKLKSKSKRTSCSSVAGGTLKCFKFVISPVDFPKNVVVCRFYLNTENVGSLIALPQSYKKAKRVAMPTTRLSITSSKFTPARLKPINYSLSTKPSTISSLTDNQFPTTYSSGFTYPVSDILYGDNSFSFNSSTRSNALTRPSTATTSSSIFGISTAINSLGEQFTAKFKALTTIPPATRSVCSFFTTNAPFPTDTCWSAGRLNTDQPVRNSGSTLNPRPFQFDSVETSGTNGTNSAKSKTVLKNKPVVFRIPKSMDFEVVPTTPLPTRTLDSLYTSNAPIQTMTTTVSSSASPSAMAQPVGTSKSTSNSSNSRAFNFDWAETLRSNGRNSVNNTDNNKSNIFRIPKTTSN